MRDEIDDVEALDVLQIEEVDGLRLLLAEDGHEHVDRRDLLPRARLHVEDRALQHALEAERRLDLGLFFLAAQPRRGLLDECLELATQPGEICAAGLQHLDDRRRVEQREQQMLDGDELVPLFARALKSLVQTVFELAR